MHARLVVAILAALLLPISGAHAQSEIAVGSLDGAAISDHDAPAAACTTQTYPGGCIVEQLTLTNDVTTQIRAFVQFEPKTCKDVGPGEWVVTTAPTQGKITTSKVKGPLPTGVCPNTTFTFDALSYTGEATTLPVADSFVAHWTSPGFPQSCAKCNIEVTADIALIAANQPPTSLVAAILPESRSVEVGATATAFATIINSGSNPATACSIAPQSSIPATFTYQTTDPTTNALTGTQDLPALLIAAGTSQSFVVALTPTAAFPPADIAFNFSCSNANTPTTLVGINTLNLSGSSTPVPDVVALAASGDPGYVDIPGSTGTGVFAVASINLGIDATVTVAANTGAATLPVSILVCETNPTSGACVAAPAPTAVLDIPPNATPTFGIFATGSGSVSDDPGANRIFVTFTDSSGVLRGETSVAVRTQ